MGEVINIHYDRSDNFKDVCITFNFPSSADTSSMVCSFRLQEVKWIFDKIIDHKITIIITKDIIRKLSPGYYKGMLQVLDGPRGYQNTLTQDFNIDRKVPSSPDQIINVECPNIFDGSNDKFFAFEQGMPSDTWVINHNLNKKPSVEIVDSADTIITPDQIKYNDMNTVTVYFLAAFAGKAYCN